MERARVVLKEIWELFVEDSAFSVLLWLVIGRLLPKLGSHRIGPASCSLMGLPPFPFKAH
jgi:hypothetical protein